MYIKYLSGYGIIGIKLSEQLHTWTIWSNVLHMSERLKKEEDRMKFVRQIVKPNFGYNLKLLNTPQPC